MPVAPRPLDAYREEVDCVACGCARFSPLTEELSDTDAYGETQEPYASMRFGFVRCDNCGTAYLRQRVAQAKIGYFYNTEYHCYQSFEERGFIFRVLSQALTRAKIKTIERLFPDQERCLLDYGCGTGTWLDLLRRAGVTWDLVGTEISQAQIEKVRELGLTGYACDESTIGRYVAPESVGVIHMFHVIEHLSDPVKTLTALRELLKPGGAIFGQTPNIASWDCRLFGRYWSQWHVPRHLVLYTPEHLRQHARAAGLEVVEVKNSLVSATNWAASLQKWWTLRRGRTYGGLQSGALYPLLTVGMIPLTLLQSALSWTSDLDFVFVRAT